MVQRRQKCELTYDTEEAIDVPLIPDETTIMAKVKFGMIWSVYGKQTVDLPDNINPDDLDAVKDYLETIWADIPLPEGEYIDNSDDLDEDGEIEIIKDNEV